MLFCLTANYTHKALDAMRENPNTNRREAVEKMVTAAGGKLVEIGAGCLAPCSIRFGCPFRANKIRGF
jgi:hypothetical protein